MVMGAECAVWGASAWILSLSNMMDKGDGMR